MKILDKGYENKKVIIITKSGTVIKGILDVKKNTNKEISNLFIKSATINNMEFCEKTRLDLEDVEIIAINYQDV